MYVKWEDIKEEALKESGISEEELDNYLNEFSSNLREVHHFSFDLFTMGKVNFIISFLKKMVRQDNEKSYMFVGALLKYYTKMEYATIPDIAKVIAKREGISIPKRTPPKRFTKMHEKLSK